MFMTAITPRMKGTHSVSALPPQSIGASLLQGLKPDLKSARDAPLKRCSTQSMWWALIPLTLALIAAVVPWLIVRSPEIGLALRRGFALVCHQRPDRSLVMFSGTVAVCARCLGIYLGAAVGLLLRLPRRFAWRLLIAAAMLNFVDWAAEIADLHGNWMSARLALGIALGATAAMLVIANNDSFATPTEAKAA
jgi:uncharacterized membrane protein